MKKSKLEISKERGPHLKLASLVGKWSGNTQTWFEPNVLADDSPIQATISPIMNGRFIDYDYTGHILGKPFEGKMTWAYDVDNEKCLCSWVDTFHMGTAIMLSEGEETKNGFVTLGSYNYPNNPKPWGWRTELEIIHPNQFIIRAFNISPEGEEAKATETIYHKIDL